MIVRRCLKSVTIVKGATDLLNKDLRKYFIQTRETLTGFEGLVDQPGMVRKLMDSQHHWKI